MINSNLNPLYPTISSLEDHSQPPQTPIPSLPNEIYAMIFECSAPNNDISKLCGSRLVSRSWKHLIDCEIAQRFNLGHVSFKMLLTFLKIHELFDSGSKKRVAKLISGLGEKLTYVNLKGIKFEYDILNEITPICSNVTHLELSDIDFRMINSSFSSWQKLHTLVLERCKGFPNLKNNKNSLQHLNLKDCQKIDYLDLSTFKSLNSLQIIPPFVEHSQLNLPESLESLNLKGLKHLTNKDLQTLVNNYQKLTSLEIKDVYIAEFSFKKLTKLRKLLLEDCWGLPDLSDNRTTLEHLVLNGCQNLTKVNLECLEKVTHLEMNGTRYEQILYPPNLESLLLSHTPSQSFQIRHPHLKTFKLSSMRSDTRIDLDIRNCPALENLIIHDDRIRMIDASQCKHLKKIDCQMANTLTQLSITGCEALEDIHLEHTQIALLDFREFLHLKNLNIANNKQLKTFMIDGCRNLEMIVAYGRIIEQINLSGCVNLLEVDFSYTGLSVLDLRDCVNLQCLHILDTSVKELNISNQKFLKEFSGPVQTLHYADHHYLVFLECPEMPMEKIDLKHFPNLMNYTFQDAKKLNKISFP